MNCWQLIVIHNHAHPGCLVCINDMRECCVSFGTPFLKVSGFVCQKCVKWVNWCVFVSKVAAFLVPVIRVFVFGSVECTIFSLELIS